MATMQAGEAFVPVKISEVAQVSDMQVRTRTDAGVVKRYAQAMRAGAEFPPIIVADVDGVLLLVDGFHRVSAMSALGISETPAVIVKSATIAEARWLAGKANLSHGFNLKARERRSVFQAYVHASQHRKGTGKRGPLKSYREMGSDLGGIPHTSVRRWMQRDFPSVFLAMGEDHANARGGLPDAESASRVFAREVESALDHAMATLSGVSDPVERGRLLAKVDALKQAIEEASVEQEEPF